MTAAAKVIVTVDRDVCVGHGRCYALAPDIFEPDEQGFSSVVGEVTDDEQRRELDMAKRNCPEQAVLVHTQD